MSFSLSSIGTILALLASSVVYFLYRLYSVRSFYKTLPGPPHSFLWGHLKELGDIAATLPPKSHHQLFLTALARKYDLEGIFYLDLWPIAPCQVILTDPELQEYVTVKKPLPMHPMSMDFVGPMIGREVIAVANGSKWKSLHNAMLPAFSWSHIRNLTGIMVDECDTFRKTLDRFSKTGETFSLESALTNLVFDIIAVIVFNFSLNAQTQGSQHLSNMKEMVELAEIDLDMTKKLNPWVQLKTFFRRRTVLKRLHEPIIEKIQERLDLLLRDKIVPSRRNPTSILDLMLRDKIQDEEGRIRSSKSIELSSEEMRILVDNMKGLLVGGHGTTTDSLCYTYMLLSKSPEIVARLRTEHEEILGKTYDQTTDTLLASPEKIQDLHYTDAVLREALRLFPVGFGMRIGSPGDTVTFRGQQYPIDRNLGIANQNHDTQYNPTYFPKPSKFDPDRWLDPDNKIPASCFRTFSRGPRACLGQNMAMNEMKIILALTIGDYDFECAGLKPNAKPKSAYTDLDTVFGDIVFQEIGLEARPRGGMMMTVRKRQRD